MDFSPLIKKIPSAPGIYLFYNTRGELIYAGKAASLKDRVRSYFHGRHQARPVEEMIHEVMDIKWHETNSVLEAVIAESIYIKKFLPVYNVIGKDDKGWNYIIITKDQYPRVETIRQREFSQLENPGRQFLKVFGPYPGLNTKATMKLLRRIFRFSSCAPGQGRPCLYYEMGQCLGPCVAAITPHDYRLQIIRPLSLFLSGRTRAVIDLFSRQMKAASKARQYEDAARLRDQQYALEHIQDIALINKSFFEDPVANGKPAIQRIEGYDISNLGETEKVGSLVVFGPDGPVKSGYRRFIVRSVAGPSDVECLAEVIGRRLRHSEWPLPDVFLIDGGRAQVQAAAKALRESGVERQVLGIAKGPVRKRNDIILGPGSRAIILWAHSHRKLLTQVRDEAHRFAVKFHRERRGRGLRRG